MRYLLDTHLVIWIADEGLNHLLPDRVRSIVLSDDDVVFSVVNIWEIVIKKGLGRKDFQVDAEKLRLGALAFGYEELQVTAAHVLAVENLPGIHKDPFDRLLIAQARTEDLTLLTRDTAVAGYGENVMLV